MTDDALRPNIKDILEFEKWIIISPTSTVLLCKMI